MGNTISNTSNLLFKVNQIICLEHQQSYLYGEVIQLIPERGLCWFRPMCIVRLDNDTDQVLDTAQLIDLQLGSDLLWPTTLFRPALDTEIISFLAQLDNVSSALIPKISNRQHLNAFVRAVWQANKDKF